MSLDHSYIDAFADSPCESAIIPAWNHPEHILELLGAAESSFFAPLRRFGIVPVPAGTWPIVPSDIVVDTGLGLLQVDQSLDEPSLRRTWPDAPAAFNVLKQAGFAPDTLRLGHFVHGFDDPQPLVLAAKRHPRICDVAVWVQLEIGQISISTNLGNWATDEL